DQEVHHAGFIRACVTLLEQPAQPHDAGQCLPSHGSTLRQVEQQLLRGVDEAGGVLGALQVARHPVQALCGTGQHQEASATIHVSLLPPPCEEFTTSEPARMATRVRPPVVTYMPCDCSTKGRMSR